MAARRTIGLLVNFLVGDYQMGLVRAVEEAASASDLHLLVVVGRALGEPNPVDRSWNDVYERIGPQTLDGLIIGSGCISTFIGIDRLAEFCRRYSPLPLCSVSAEVPGIPSVVISNHQGMRVIVDHLIEVHGCRRIAHIRGPLGGDEAQARFEGYVASLAEHGIAFDPDLVETGDFWVTTGAEGMQRILDRAKKVDAVVAANDYMALGALDVLRRHRIRVPVDVLVTGFDDVPAACIASPSLTTVRQPLQVLGRKSVDILRQQLAGEVVAERLEVGVELVTRQSCGCSYRIEPRASTPVPPVPRDALSELQSRWEDLRQRMNRCVRGASDALGDWADRLLATLRDDLSGRPGQFLIELEEVLVEADSRGIAIDEFNAVIAVLRHHFRSIVKDGREMRRLDDVWFAATLLVGGGANRREVRARFGLENAQDILRRSVERLSAALSHPALIEGLHDVLPAAKISAASISLYDDPTAITLRPFFVHGREDCPRDDGVYASDRLAPAGFFRSDPRSSYFVMALAFGAEPLGIAVFEAGAEAALYSMLRQQIGAALKGAALHRAVVEETELRERAEREQLHKEMEIARRVQTAILPTSAVVEGLDIAAVMLPAAEVGGDYYDVLPTETGCWIGIGDVTGHGLLASLVMMMIQAMVAAMVKNNPGASPSRIFVALNAALYDNVRNRLRRDEQATLSLIRYERDGKLTFAGNHEEILVCRAETGACERIATPGLWLGAVPDVTDFTSDSSAKLDHGDLLVLFTDGVVEAMNPQREQFGVERLCAIIETERSRSPEQVCGALAEAVRQWTASQRDDISLVVARYRAPSSG